MSNSLNNIDTFLGLGDELAEYNSFDKAKAVILPIPYEGTVSYGKGAALGPQAIINASAYVELYDEELDKETYKIGITTAKPVKTKATPEGTIEEIYKAAKILLDKKKLVAGIGGEHSISQGIYKALKEKFGNVSVLQLDAHSDLRDVWNNSKYSHAAVMRRISEMAGRVSEMGEAENKIVQVGIRSIDIEEKNAIQSGKVKTNIFYAKDIVPLSAKGDYGWIEKIVALLKGKRVFITFDVDAFEPSIIPATGTPEPGGLDWYTSLKLLRAVFENSDVVGFDVVELAPIKGLIHPDFTAAKLVYKMLGYKFCL